jgi:DNA replication protein DnaC
MGIETTLERLRSFKLRGLTDELELQSSSTQYLELSFEERLSLLVDAEYTRRNNSRIQATIKNAQLPNSVSLDDLDFSVSRGIKKGQILELSQGSWLKSGINIIITGQTGVGKTFLGSVIAHALCLRGCCVKFRSTQQHLIDLKLSDEKQHLAHAVSGYQKVELLIFDEWLRDSVQVSESRILLDLLDHRYKKRSCMFISQIPVSQWHAKFADPTMADAILDRIVHNSIRLELQGESMRKLMSNVGTLGMEINAQNSTSLRSDNHNKII